MIYTITLNPAVDQTIMINDFNMNQVNRVTEKREDAGGKGINVSKMIKNLHGESIAMGIIGGRKGIFIESWLKKNNINTDFVKRSTDTRTNIKIVDHINNTYTDINEGGGEVSLDTVLTLEDKLFTNLSDSDIMVLAGSVPNNVKHDIYARWIELGKLQNTRTILDADGDLLALGVKAGPYLIKPNIYELETLCNKKISSIKECIETAKQLFEYDIKIIVVSMGAEGSLVITKDKTIKANALKVPVMSTVGAGDSMVGAIAYALQKGDSIEEAIILGVAASSATIGHEGTIMGSLEEVEILKRQVALEYL